MPKKKHCDKHYRYVASCPECRALNNEEPLAPGEGRRLYPDIGEPDNLDGVPPEEPNEDYRNEGRYGGVGGGTGFGSGGRGPGGPYMGGPGRPSRYQYRPSTGRSNRKIYYIVSIFSAIIVLILMVYAIPKWHARISLQEQLYYNKSGGLLFWDDIYTMGGWSSNFFFNKTALLGAVIGSAVMSIPPDKNIMYFIKKRTGRGTLKTGKVLLFWWTAGFAFFYLVGQGIDNGYFALTMYMFHKGTLSTDDLTGGNIFNAFNMISHPERVSMLDMYVFQTVVHPIINYIFGLILVRFILNIVMYSYYNPNGFRMLGNIFFFLSDAFVLGLFGAVGAPQDALTLIKIYSVWIGIFLFFILGVYMYILDKRNPGAKLPALSAHNRRRAIGIGILLIFIILFPVFMAVPKQISLTNYESWKENLWDVRYERQIKWTRDAAGLNLQVDSGPLFRSLEIENYTDSMTVDDYTIINTTRQYDKTISGSQLVKEIKTTYESMADSDIVYVPGKGEFWIAPKTLDIGFLEQQDSAVNLHTEKYDHVNGFVALDSSTGNVIDSSKYKEIFGVTMDEAKIFFGEEEDKSYSFSSSNEYDTYDYIRAYDNDILLYTGWGNGTYKGTPDGNLTGIEAFWFTMGMQLTNYAFDNKEKSYLINRNIKTRVGAALLPGLMIDPDPYLVFDRNNSRIYYCVSIYTRVPIEGYSFSHLYRFMGVVLIDQIDGGLHWYLNPKLPTSAQDPLSSIWKIYLNQYPWESVPGWLLEQLRYPETLWERQLSVDYIYHVQDPQIWNMGNDFFERPDQGDVFFIETDVGDGLEFCGIDLVEYIGQGATKLAGMYILRLGAEHFGETILYKVPKDQTLIGPETAKSQFETEATNRISLINNPRYGNKLLYPLAGSLYYFIPVYSSSTDAYGDTYEELALTGLINAFDKSVYYGDNVWDAYQDLALDRLNQTEQQQGSESDNIDLSVTGDDEVQYSDDNWATFKIIIDYWNSSTSLPQRNVKLNLTIQTSKLPNNEYLNFTVKLFGNDIKGYNFTLEGTDVPALNYTIQELALYPGEGRILTVMFKPETYVGGTSITYLYSFSLLDADNGDAMISTTGWRSITFVH